MLVTFTREFAHWRRQSIVFGHEAIDEFSQVNVPTIVRVVAAKKLHGLLFGDGGPQKFVYLGPEDFGCDAACSSEKFEGLSELITALRSALCYLILQ